MRKFTFTLLVTALLYTSGIHAQLFQNFIGKADPREFGNSVTQQVDSTYLIGGNYRNTFSGNDFPAIIHLKKNGSVDWVRQLNLPGQPSSYVQYAEAVRSTTGTKDGYIALLSGAQSIFVVRLTNAGTVSWARKLANGATPTLLTLRVKPAYSSATSLPSFYVLAWDYNTKAQLVIKLNSSGSIIWQRSVTHSVSGNSYIFRDMKVTSDSGCVVTGYESTASTSKPVIFKFSPLGSVTMAKVYDFFSTAYNGGFGVAEVSGGGYVVTGDENNGKDNLTFKTTSAGAILWGFKYTTAGTNQINGQAVVTDASGNIIVAGTNYNPLYLNDAFLMKLTSSGTVSFAKEYYGHSDINDLKLTKQGYCAVGTSDPSNVLSDIYVIQTNTSGNIASSCQPASVTYTRVSPEFNSVVNAGFINSVASLTNVAVTVNSPSITTEEARCGTASPASLINEGTIAGTLTAYQFNANSIRTEYKVAATDAKTYEVKLYNLNGDISASSLLKANEPVVLQAANLQQGMYMVTVTCKGEFVAQQKIMVSK